MTVNYTTRRSLFDSTQGSIRDYIWHAIRLHTNYAIRYSAFSPVIGFVDPRVYAPVEAALDNHNIVYLGICHLKNPLITLWMILSGFLSVIISVGPLVVVQIATFMTILMALCGMALPRLLRILLETLFF